MKTALRSDEKKIIDGCLANNRDAQKALFDKYKNGMFTVAYRIVNNYDDANDALQDAFIQVFRDLAKFQQRSTLGAWIKTIVVRSSLKKAKYQRRIESFDTERFDTPVVWNSNLTGEYLDRAIRSLSIGYRTVFTLIEVEGYSHKEVAEVMGISVGTSKSQLYHAKKHLQRLLKDLR